MSDLSSTIVLLGIDGDSKPHAARFEQRYQAAALRAALLMGLKAVTVGEDVDAQKAAAQLPHGKIFATGRGLVPLVKRAIYDKLAALVGTAQELAVAEVAPQASNDSSAGKADAEPAQAAASDVAGPAPTLATEATTDGWAAITVGTMVLAKSPDPDEGWYEAYVLAAASDTDELTLRFRD